MVSDLGFALCYPVGGELVLALNGSYVFPGALNSTQAPVPYTGGASALLKSPFGWGVLTVVVMLGGMAFVGLW